MARDQAAEVRIGGRQTESRLGRKSSGRRQENRVRLRRSLGIVPLSLLIYAERMDSFEEDF